MTRTVGRILLLPVVLATGVLAQTPAAPAPPIKTPPAVTLSDTERIALQSVLEERKQLGAKLQAIDTDVRKSHPGYHLEWGLENVTLVKDADVKKEEKK